MPSASVNLLRVCFRSRYSWALRTLLPFSAGRVAVAADEALARLIALVLPRHNTPPLHQEWLHLKRMHAIKLALPVVKGGLALRSWTSLQHITHFSSWIESGPRILKLVAMLGLSLPLSISNDIGNSVAHLSATFDAPPEYWHMDGEKPRHKVQHELTDWLDAVEIAEASNLSHDPAVNAQFIGSCTPAMSMPFNCTLVPRYILDSLDNYAFSYALAWHVMMPLFPVFQCPCKQTWDPLGLHAAMCTKLNAYNLIHNSVRDCFAGAARSVIRDDSDSNVAFILTDAHAKSATYIHDFYPLKADAPSIKDRANPADRSAPSLSPDILISFNNNPLNPYFGDFVASSPSLVNNKVHGEAAQAAYLGKLQHYFKHHQFPSRVFYPLAFERSGYLHPMFGEFIDLYAISCSPKPALRTKLQLYFSVAFAITFTTASLLKAASFLLLPHAVQTLVAPHALPMPTRWAPEVQLPRSRTQRAPLAPVAPLVSSLSDSDLSTLTNGNQDTLSACTALDAHILRRPLPPASLMSMTEGFGLGGGSLHD